MFIDYIQAGFCVIPSKGGMPIVKWGKYQDKPPTFEEAQDWSGNIELVCGKVSGIIALDFDTDDARKIAQVEAIAGISPVKKKGSKGFTAFYRYNGEKGSSWNGEIELLSDKHLTCLPPSLHRKTGKPYEWLDKQLIGSELPALNPKFSQIMDLMYDKKPKIQPVQYIKSEEIEFDEIERMLDFISPDCSRDEWIVIGMGLRDEFGDLARSLWHEWSAKSIKYKQRDAEIAWKSFNSSGVSIGTIIHKAKEGGWLPALKVKEPNNNYDNYLSSLQVELEIKQETPQIGGLVGMIADWITATAIRPQPMLSLGAAISFVGMLKGHRITGATGLRTNMLIMNLAPSTYGKEYPQYCINQLAEYCGLDNHLLGEPTSGSALLQGINKGQSVSLFNCDELGRYIGNLSLKTTGGYQREIIDYIIKLFSKANSTFRGKQYANEKENPQIILYQPHFCCLGSTVPEKLQSACTSGEVIDGFLNRWLLFSADKRPDEQHGNRSKTPPQEILDAVATYISKNPITYSSGAKPTPEEVRFDKDAFLRLKHFKQDMLKLMDNSPYPLNQLYGRAGEHCEKLAMVLCDDLTINLQNVKNAIKIVDLSNVNISKFASGIADTQHEADLIYIFDKIKDAGKIKRSNLTRRTQKLNQRIRNDILNQLLEAGQIGIEKDFSGNDIFYVT